MSTYPTTTTRPRAGVWDDLVLIPASPEAGRTDGKRTRSPSPTQAARDALAAAKEHTTLRLHLQYSGAEDAWMVCGSYASRSGGNPYILRTDGRFVEGHSGKVAGR